MTKDFPTNEVEQIDALLHLNANGTEDELLYMIDNVQNRTDARKLAKYLWPLIQAQPQTAVKYGDALTNVGPDLRVVPVRVLQSAYDRIDAMLANIEPDLRAANSVRIELRHLINETHSGSPLTRPHHSPGETK